MISKSLDVRGISNGNCCKRLSERPTQASQQKALGKEMKLIKRGRGKSTVVFAARTSESSSTNILESFYYGRAFAEVLTEKISSAVIMVLSDIGQRDAEQRQFWREVQEEVEARVQETLPSESTSRSLQSTRNGQPNARAGQTQASLAVQSLNLDLQELVDDLRAEIATARFSIQAYKNARKQAIPNRGPMRK